MSDLSRLPFRAFEGFSPLVTAAEGFPAFERLALQARHHLWLSFRIFDPTTRLREVTDVGDTWCDLLKNRLADGVQVRVLLTDFDPIVGPELHEASVRAAAALSALEDYGDIQTMIVRHEARVGKGMRIGLWLPAARMLESERQRMNARPLNDRTANFQNRPGVWRYLRLRSTGKIVWRIPKIPRLYPATFHQKIAIADHQRAIIGGLDINERRYDSPRHEQKASQTWHDVSVQVSGDIVSDISLHIATCWNENRLRMMALRREQLKHAPPDGVVLPSRFDPLETRDIRDPEACEHGLRLLRTKSVRKRRVGFQFSPQEAINEIETAHLAAIAAAKQVIYIETQYFRSQVIADALAKAARDNPKVQLVMILPAAPDIIAFEKKSGLPERMGEHLQSECLKIVQDAFAKRAAILSPVRKSASDSDARDQLYGADIIYVHSKVLVTDDLHSIVGSANLNGRSLKWDTEAAVECNDPKTVDALRHDLLAHWLEDDPDPAYFDLEKMAEVWGALARRNTQRAPEQREGFLVPHDPAPAQDIGLSLPVLPDELV